MQPIAKQRGVGLIELLIALFIVAVGLLGHGFLQLQSLQQTQTARYQRIANQALQDLSERTLVVPAAALADEFNYDNLDSGTAPTTTADCSAVSCTRAQMARYRLVEWYTQLAASLPSPRVAISRSGSLLSVQMTWDANLSGNGAASCHSSGQEHHCAALEWRVQ